jgi:hypothetical protein
LDDAQIQLDFARPRQGAAIPMIRIRYIMEYLFPRDFRHLSINPQVLAKFEIARDPRNKGRAASPNTLTKRGEKRANCAWYLF